MATFTKAQLKRIIKEEYEAVMNETDNLFGERAYDHSLVSNVSKTLQWEIDQAFNFILDLLEDVNAHSEYEAVKKVFSTSFKDVPEDSLTEGNKQVSKLITKLELVLNTVDGAMGYIENPAAEQRFQKALDLGQELWEDMHDLLDGGSKDGAEADAFAQSKYALEEKEKAKVVSEMNPDGTISSDEADLLAHVDVELDELIRHLSNEAERIGGKLRAPEIRRECKELMLNKIGSMK